MLIASSIKKKFHFIAQTAIIIIEKFINNTSF